METELEFAKSRLFDQDALRVSNIKFFPGKSRDVTVEMMAVELNKTITQIENGDYELITDLED